MLNIHFIGDEDLNFRKPLIMATHGSIGEFNPSVEDWTSYMERLEQYFTTNGIPSSQAEKRRAVLLSVCGASTYQLTRSLTLPSKLTEESFARIVQLVREP